MIERDWMNDWSWYEVLFLSGLKSWLKGIEWMIDPGMNSWLIGIEEIIDPGMNSWLIRIEVMIK